MRKPFSHFRGGLKSPTRQSRSGDGAPPLPCAGGFTLNGFTLNRFTLNGFILNRFTVNGFIVNGFIPPVDALRHGFSRKPFRMRRYEKCACKCPGIRSYKNKGLKLLWNQHLQKKPGDSPSFASSASFVSSASSLAGGRAKPARGAPRLRDGRGLRSAFARSPGEILSRRSMPRGGLSGRAGAIPRATAGVSETHGQRSDVGRYALFLQWLANGRGFPSARPQSAPPAYRGDSRPCASSGFPSEPRQASGAATPFRRLRTSPSGRCP